MGDFVFNTDLGTDSSGDASAYIGTVIDSPGPAPSTSPQSSTSQTTSWIQDALGYASTGIQAVSGIASRLGISVGGISTNQPGAPANIGQNMRTGGQTGWILWVLLAAVALVLLVVLL